jgi:hypothetical protein
VAHSPRQYRKFAIVFICRASTVSGTKISVPIVLAEQKGHKRIGEAQKTILLRLTYWSRNHQLISCTHWKGKFVLYKVEAYYMTRKMSSITVPGQ